jgi:23S rRNA pseudouridine1911/1915/1917 synthase
MSHIGHPIFSDEKYGGDKLLKGTALPKFKQFIDNAFKLMPRQALHATELGFVHPTTGESMFFKQELPEDFKGLYEKIKKYTTPKF